LAQTGSLIFNSNSILNFEKTPMRIIVPYSILYTSIFYLKKFEQPENHFDHFKFEWV
jgi:hypothetical protein